MHAVLGPLVRLKTRNLCNCISLRASWNSLVALTAPAVEELRYWLQSVNDLNIKGADLQESDLCDLEAYANASEISFGGYVIPAKDGLGTESVCDSSDLQTDCSLVVPSNSLHTVTGSWSESEKRSSSTWREIEAVNRLVESSVHILENRTLKLNTDNKNVTSIINNGSRKTDLQTIACELHTLCADHNIKLASQWIPREQSKIADNFSIYSDCEGDWGIHRDVLEELDALWGTHTVDRFATDYNSKCISLIQNAGVKELRQ